VVGRKGIQQHIMPRADVLKLTKSESRLVGKLNDLIGNKAGSPK
jgi:hypothetical protein